MVLRSGRRFVRRVMLVAAILLPLVIVYFWVRSYLVGDELYRAESTVGPWPSGAVAEPAGWFLYHLQNEESGIESANGSVGLYLMGQESVRGSTQPEISKSISGLGWRKIGATEGNTTGVLGFAWDHGEMPLGDPPQITFRPLLFGERHFFIAVPYWALFLGAGALLGWRIQCVRWWRDRVRRREGLCEKCGYDLRASAAGCPECGDGREVKGELG